MLWRTLVTSSLRCYSSSRPSSRQPNNHFSAIFYYSLLGFSQLQGFQKCSYQFGVWYLLDFFPSQRLYHYSVRASFQIYRSPFPGFCNLLTGSFYVVCGLRAYSIPLTLQGFSLQSFPDKWFQTVIQFSCSFTVACLTWFPFLDNLCSLTHCHWGFPFQRLDSRRHLALINKSWLPP